MLNGIIGRTSELGSIALYFNPLLCVAENSVRPRYTNEVSSKLNGIEVQKYHIPYGLRKYNNS